MRTDPELQESAILQVLMTRAKVGRAEVSARTLAELTGLSRTSVQRTLERLQSSGQIEALRPKSGPVSTIWVLPRLLAQKAAQTFSNVVEKPIPTMPFQLLPPSGEGSSWFERTYRDLTRVNLSVRQGLIQPSCHKCNDTGYDVEPTSVEYTRDWLHICHCEAGEWKVIPEMGEYVPAKEQGLCRVCQSTGWVYAGDYVQRCFSCNKTWS